MAKKEHKATVTYYNNDEKKKVTKSFESQRAAVMWARGQVSGREKAFARIVGPLYVISWRTTKYEVSPDNVSEL